MCEAGRSFPYVNTHTRHRQASPTTVCMHGIGGVAAEYYLTRLRVFVCVFLLPVSHACLGRRHGRQRDGMAEHSIAWLPAPDLAYVIWQMHICSTAAESQMGAVLLCTMMRASNAGWWLGGGKEKDHHHVLDRTSSRMYTAPIELLLLFLG